MDENIENLERIQGLTSSIVNLNTQIAEQSDKRNKRLAEETRSISSIVSGIRTQEDISNSMLALERRKNIILQSNYGINEQYKQNLLETLTNSINLLETEQLRLDNLNRVEETSNRVENRLTDIQKLTSSLVTLNTEIAERIDDTDTRLAEESKTISSIVSGISSQEDISEAVLALERRKNIILQSNYGINEQYKQDLLKNLDTSIKTLKAEQLKLDTLKKVEEVSNGIGKSLKDGLESIKSQIAQIPVLGNALSKIVPTEKFNQLIDGITTGFNRGFNIMFKRARSQGQGFVKSFSTGLRGGMAGVSKAIGPLLSNPYTAAAVAAAAFIAIGILAFSQVEGAAKKFREETGLLNSQTENLGNQITTVTSKYAHLGVSLDDVSSAAVAFTKEFDNIEMASNAVLGSMAVLNKNFGVSLETSAKVNKQFQLLGGYSAETAQNMINTTVEAAKLAGVAPNQVMQDIANSSADAFKFFGGSVGALSKAAIEAAKLGTSIQQAVEVSNQLLQFESSINSELEASAILGTNINFNQSRRLAANGDILGAQQAVVSEVSKLGDLTRLNIFEQEALANAAGMPIQDLIRQQQIRERFGHLDKEQLAAANALVDAGMEVGDISEEQLAKENERLAKQQEMQSSFESLANRFKAVGTELLLAFAPIGEIIMEVFLLLTPIVSGFMKPIGNAIKGIVSAFQELKEPFNDIFGEGSGDGLKKTLEFIGTLLGGTIAYQINFFTNSLKMVLSIVTGITKVLKGIFTGDLEMIGDGLMDIFEGILRKVKSTPIVLYETLVDMFPSIGEFFTSLAGKIKNFFIGILPGWAQRLLGGGDISSDVSTAKQTKVTEVEDAVISPSGNIISTDPNDFLIATKNPSELGSTSAGGGSLLEEIRGLRADLNSGKVAVYMDGIKVTQRISNVVENSAVNSYST